MKDTTDSYVDMLFFMSSYENRNLLKKTVHAMCTEYSMEFLECSMEVCDDVIRVY